jgi:uncharacterized membrane protein YjjP (DUF1212 family)
MKRLSQEPLLKKKDFIYKLAILLSEYGCPAHRIESNLNTVADCLRINGAFVVLPSLIIITLGEQDSHSSDTHIIKTTPGYEMARLQLVEDALTDLFVGKNLFLSLSDMTERLNEIRRMPSQFSYFWKIMGYGLFSAGSSPLLFSGGWWDCLASFVLGSLVGVLIELSAKMNTLSNIMEVISAIVVSFAARGLSIAYSDYICYWSVALASVVWLLPGLSITCSVMEMATRNIISGTVHMFYSFIVVSCSLYFNF